MAPRPKPRFGRWVGLRREDIDLAKRRTTYLLETWPMGAQTPPIKLANAYLQGVADAAETQRGELT